SERRLQLAKLEQEQADDPFGDRDFEQTAPDAAAPAAEASGTEPALDDELDEYDDDDEDEDDVNAQAARGGR
ncbi:MAG: hypothetical protein ACRDGF_08115, partial [Chloroflexota bacterium]